MKRQYAVILALVLFLSVALSPCTAEHAPWDCPECEREGNTGNFCGGCGHPAPWMEAENPTAADETEILTSDVAAEPEISSQFFPDEAFRTFVSGFDRNGDGKFSTEEIAAVTEMNCSEMQIASLKGIECFTVLEKLNCSRNALEEIDISRNASLLHLDCSRNRIRSIDVSHNPQLQYISMYDNQLSLLDTSQNPELIEIRTSKNQLTDLNLSCNPKLETLFCNNNQLSALDISGNPELRALECSDNMLKSLDLSGNPALERIRINGNAMESIDISPCVNLLTAYRYGEQKKEKTLLIKYPVPGRNETNSSTVEIRDVNSFVIQTDIGMEMIANWTGIAPEEQIPILSQAYPGISAKLKTSTNRWQSKFGPGGKYADGSGGYKADKKHSNSLTVFFCENGWVFADIIYSSAFERYAFLPQNAVNASTELPQVTDLGYAEAVLAADTVPYWGPESTYNQNTACSASAGTQIKIFFRENDYVFAEYSCGAGLVRTWLPIENVLFD